MQLGMIGLGKMGSNMTRSLLRGGHDLVVYDKNAEAGLSLVEEGAICASSLVDLTSSLSSPRAVWVMLPAGDITEKTIKALAEILTTGDIIIDGGNTYFKDDVRRVDQLRSRYIHFVDVGTSGGVWGLERGYSMTIGGDAEIVQYLDPLFSTLAAGSGSVKNSAYELPVSAGYAHVGPTGSGHFVKMIHNGIEYGMMQAFAEGFEILREAASERVEPQHQYELDLHRIAEVWRNGSVVSSWLLDLLEAALKDDHSLKAYSGYVQDSGEGRWTVQTAIEEDVPAHVLTASLYARFQSRQDQSYAARVLSALRRQFGGHVEQKGAKR